MNSRTPTRLSSVEGNCTSADLDPKSNAFGLAWQPPLVMCGLHTPKYNRFERGIGRISSSRWTFVAATPAEEGWITEVSSAGFTQLQETGYYNR